MDAISFGKEYLSELESEVRASRRCVEAVPDKLYKWKPHETSMEMGYLTLLVADIPRWITYTLEQSEIDFATFPQFKMSTTSELVRFFDKNIEDAKRALGKVSNDDLKNDFSLKRNGTVLFTSSKKDSVQSSLNHWVHHRGQLTVYMRMNGIKVPSIYGPSADDRVF